MASKADIYIMETDLFSQIQKCNLPMESVIKSKSKKTNASN